MNISYHALRRMRQRSISAEEIEEVLANPTSTRKSFGNRVVVEGRSKKRTIKIILTENYKRIITVM